MITSTLGGGGTKGNFKKTALSLIKYAPKRHRDIKNHLE